MAYNTSVKYFHSGMTGAPSLTGTAGAFIALLDACLKDGFGSQTATSLSVASGIATLTVPASHPYDVHTVVLVAGSTPSGLNGEKRVLTKSTNTITFDATGISDGVATGTITVKLAPAGWNKPFSGTSLAAYQSSNAASTKTFLRVDDTATQNATVRAYESMSDINSGTGPCPTLSQAANAYWCKANGSAGTARPWIVIADDKTLWVKVCTVPSGLQFCGITYGAGDFKPRKTADAYNFFLIAPTTDTSATSSIGAVACYYGLAHTDYLGEYSGWVLKSSSGIGPSLLLSKRSEMYGSFTNGGISAGGGQSGNAFYAYPNGPDNALLLSRYMVADATNSIRGVLRGPLYCPQVLPTSGFAALTTIDGQGDMADRKLMIVNGNTSAGTAYDGRVMFFDITGPWE